MEHMHVGISTHMHIAAHAPIGLQPRWAPWIDGEECWEVGHVDTPAAVAAKYPLEMGGYADLDEFERSWNARASGPAAR